MTFTMNMKVYCIVICVLLCISNKSLAADNNITNDSSVAATTAASGEKIDNLSTTTTTPLSTNDTSTEASSGATTENIEKNDNSSGVPSNSEPSPTKSAKISNEINAETIDSNKISETTQNSDVTTTKLPTPSSSTTTTTTTQSSITTTASNNPTTPDPDADYQKITTVERLIYRSMNVGLPVKAHTFGWHVTLAFSNTGKAIESRCNGAIISKYYLVTVAHCLFDMWSTNKTVNLTMYPYVKVSAGGTIKNAQSFNQLLRLVNGTNVFYHPDYINDKNNKYLSGDIALIKLNTPFPIDGESIQTIKLNELHSRRDLLDQNIYMTGWGTDRKELRYQIFELNPAMTCRVAYGPRVCTTRVFTTYGLNTYDDSICRVESGSPLVAKKRWSSATLIGLATFVSKDGCGAGHPDGYTKIAYYYNWIYDTLNTHEHTYALNTSK